MIVLEPNLLRLVWQNRNGIAVLLTLVQSLCNSSVQAAYPAVAPVYWAMGAVQDPSSQVDKPTNPRQPAVQASSTTAADQAAGEAPLPVRPANRELYQEAAGLVEKLRRLVDRIAARARKPEEIRSATAPVKLEIVEAYKILHQIGQLADELTLRGELDGVGTQIVSQTFRVQLDGAVAQLRPYLGSAEGLTKAADRRAKDQGAALKQLDEAIKQKQWNTAYRKLNELIDAADEVGLFVEPKLAGAVYGPILERAAKIVPQYLAEAKNKKVIPKLREECTESRPDLDALRRKLEQVVAGFGESKEIRWNDELVTGPEFVLQLAAGWQESDRQVARALSVLHAMGVPAQTELKALAADYEAARTKAVTMVPELIRGESATLAPSEVESRYAGYIAAIPILMSAVRGSAAEFQGAATALSQFAARSPELAAQVERYREATTEVLRWRRRLAERYLKAVRAAYAHALPINGLLDHPPPLPAQGGQPSVPRVNQTFLSLLPPVPQTPEFVGSVWSQHWKDLPVTVQNPVVLWLPGADPVFVSPWHGRACTESAFPRQAMDGFFQALSRDLLASPTRAPLTLEAMLAVHTAAHGPYTEIGGVVTGVVVESLPDRLWDLSHPLDVAGSLVPATLIEYTDPSNARPEARFAFPALVRLQVAPVWLAHELFVWAIPPEKPATGGAPATNPTAAAPSNPSANPQAVAPPATVPPASAKTKDSPKAKPGTPF